MQALKAALDQIESAHATFLASIASVQALQTNCITEFELTANDVLISINKTTADAHSAFLASAEVAKSNDELASRAYDMRSASLTAFEEDFKQTMALEQVVPTTTFNYVDTQHAFSNLCNSIQLQKVDSMYADAIQV